MIQRWFLSVCLALAAVTAHADPTTTVNTLISHQFLASASAQNGVATVVVGQNFANSDFQSQQDFAGTILLYLQGLDPTIQGFSYTNSAGAVIGTYSGGQLTLTAQ